ncbi:nitroreductase/quinone reductase family protein [Amycolatopsis alkalitolerans]|uniref:Nitroreductase family deazaflavin-dependent oxidoreductase n=1 Tax=Amycolatopsis alkalitolerans TaxID=2547244 RepID=A0A5C4M928_9PSEU|nr:nitroreductase/quinone reductase family protein [Amycolatopsis alkalitolerans]TNC27781.1 nitroreductase family deazaflavin-dependent oxidoreductase [Amycolatopsis alkalitolerans]
MAEYSFEIARPRGDQRTAEQWARDAWEGAPRGVRWILRVGWRLLGFRLGAPVDVLGWPVASSAPEKVVLDAPSPLLESRNVVETSETSVRWTTIVHYRNGLGRLLWTLAAPVHTRTLPVLFERAADPSRLKHRLVTGFQKRIGNPILHRRPGQILLETTGRVSGLPRRTPIGGRRAGHEFWLVSEHGGRSQYVRNIEKDPRVRVRLRGRWYPGVAHLLPDDDPVARLRALPRMNSAAVRAVGTDLLTIRVDLEG